jgi:hypothetical protein
MVQKLCIWRGYRLTTSVWVGMMLVQGFTTSVA